MVDNLIKSKMASLIKSMLQHSCKAEALPWVGTLDREDFIL
jgi:hypothetical protein